MIPYLAGFALLALLLVAGAIWIVRALLRVSEERPTPWWAVLLAAGTLLAVPAGVLAAYFLVPAPLSERSLTNSIERETGSAGLGSECTELRDGRWRCEVGDSSGSGSSKYAVATGWSCWHARRTSDRAEVPMPTQPDGCTTIRDAAGLWDIALGD